MRRRLFGDDKSLSKKDLVMKEARSILNKLTLTKVYNITSRAPGSREGGGFGRTQAGGFGTGPAGGFGNGCDSEEDSQGRLAFWRIRVDRDCVRPSLLGGHKLL
jgi:hypothetical protein